MLTPISPPVEQPIRNTESHAAQSLAQTKRDPLETELAKVSYFSPVTRIDVETQTAVLHYRNPETGQTIKQYPSEKQVQAYQRAASLHDFEVDDSEQDEDSTETSRDDVQEDAAESEPMQHVHLNV